MDNLVSITFISTGAVLLVLAVTVTRLHRQLNTLFSAVCDHKKGMEAANGALRSIDGQLADHEARLTDVRIAVQQLQEHVGVISPEQLRRMAAADHLKQEYRSLGFAVDADELDEDALRQLEATLLALKTMPIRRETDDEVEKDLRNIIDSDSTDTGPLPHTVDRTDETVFPLAPEPQNPAVPWGESNPI